MKISRRPKRRASRENAPGPKKRIAVAIAITFMMASFVSNRFAVGAGIHESAYAIAARITRTLVMGVRMPPKRQTPPENANATAPHVSNPRFRQSLR
jgi:hypothetical protein